MPMNASDALLVFLFFETMGEKANIWKKMGEKPPSPSPFAKPGCVAFWPQRRNIDGPILRYILIRNYNFTYVGFVPVPVGGDW